MSPNKRLEWIWRWDFLASAGVAGVRLARVATPEVAEPDMAEGDGDDDCRLVVTVTGKRSRVDDSSEEGEVGDRVAVPFVPLGLAAMIPVGPRVGRGRGRDMCDRERLVGHERRGKLARLRAEIWDVGNRERVAGVRNGMGGDTFRTRGSYAHARTSGNLGVRHEGFVSYRR